ncbi:MAG: hypothetical protein KDC05_04380 [Bacteroidales bacterium]|nr:hypothetical protein [Bacteroidales bacterium]
MTEIKKQLLEHCNKILREKRDHLKEAMDDAQKGANEYGLPRDRYDSFRTQLLRKRDMFAQQLAAVGEQLQTLEKISLKPLSKAGFGALVITENQKIFISVGLGKIELDGQVYVAVSPVVPIARELENKSKGESFTINGKSFTIIDIL